MVLRGNHLRYVSCDELFTDLNKVHVFGLQSLVAFSVFGFTSCTSDPTVITKKTKGGLVILTVYMDAIILIRSDNTSFLATYTYLHQHLSIHDLESPRYFLGIEFADQDEKLSFTQQKYSLDML